MEKQLDPSHIMQVGLGFWGSKALLSAVELGVFSVLAEEKSLTGPELAKRVEISERATYDFFDALVSLGFLRREGDGPEGRYANTDETAAFLDRKSPHYLGGMLEMANARLYPFWADLTEGLRTGQPQNEIKESGEPLFAKLYSEPARLEQFMNAMSGISAGNFVALAKQFDFSKYETLCDMGGATGQLSCIVAEHHDSIRCTTFDLPPVKPIADKWIAKAGLGDRVTAVAGDFFEDDIPKADVVTMGMILHDFNLEKKKKLIAKAYDALPEGGALIAIEALIDDARRQNSFGLLMSLNMLIEFGDAFDYTGADFDGWCREIGFARTEVMPLAGPSSAAIAYK